MLALFKESLGNLNPYKLFIYLKFSYSVYNDDDDIIIFKRRCVDEVFFIPFTDKDIQQTRILSSEGKVMGIKDLALQLLPLTSNSDLKTIIDDINSISIIFKISQKAYNHQDLLDSLFSAFVKYKTHQARIINEGNHWINLMIFDENDTYMSFFRGDSFYYKDRDFDKFEVGDSSFLLICHSKKDVLLADDFETKEGDKVIIGSYRIGVSQSYLADMDSLLKDCPVVIMIDKSNTLAFYWKQKYLELFSVVLSGNINFSIDGSPSKINVSILDFEDFSKFIEPVLDRNTELKNKWIKDNPDEKFDHVETGMRVYQSTKSFSFLLSKEVFLQVFDLFKNDKISLFSSD